MSLAFRLGKTEVALDLTGPPVPPCTTPRNADVDPSGIHQKVTPRVTNPSAKNSGNLTKATGFKRDLQLIRRGIHYKLKNRIRLTPAEVHVLRNFRALESKSLGPSVGSTALEVVSALFRPCLKAGCVGMFALVVAGNGPTITSSPADAAPSDEAAAEPEAQKEVSIPDLAMAIAGDAPPGDAALGEDDAPDPEIILPEVSLLNPPEVEEQRPQNVGLQSVRARHSAAAPQESEQLKRQQNLIKFLSGLIAAYRPSITDCGTIAKHIVELSATENVDPFYVAAVIAIESRFHSGAQSEVGAMGLMQLMPSTAREVASQKHVALVDPKTNIRLGISYLKQLQERYNGNRFLALAAYNWGPSNVDKAGWKANRIPGSVRKYSNTVLERTTSWQRHFAKATESANSLSSVVVAKSN
ncbi:MAG: lytic transglycosylase domain-containing protein [Bdellovibrionota bacterium]